MGVMMHWPCPFGVVFAGQTFSGGLAFMNVQVTVSPGPTFTAARRFVRSVVVLSVRFSAQLIAVRM